MFHALESVKESTQLVRMLLAFLRRLPPNMAGAVCLYQNSRDVLELNASWNLTDKAFTTVTRDDCWCLRLGKMNVPSNRHDLFCDHVAPWIGKYATQTCVSMISQGDVVGLLIALDDRREEDSSDNVHISALAEQLNLAISNVSLRDTLRHQSTVDPLTGLYNRCFFDEVHDRSWPYHTFSP